MQTGETWLTVKTTRAAAGRTNVTVVTRRRRGPLVAIHGRDESTCSTTGALPEGVLDEPEPPPELEPVEPPETEAGGCEVGPPAGAVAGFDTAVTATVRGFVADAWV